MNIEMTANEWVMLIVLGGVLGMIGQGIRVIVGLKKLNETAFSEGVSFGELFEGKSIIISLFVGFIAGSLAIIGITETSDTQQLTSKLIITILGAGYAGTDFIEGVISKYLPRNRSPLRNINNTKDLEASPVG